MSETIDRLTELHALRKVLRDTLKNRDWENRELASISREYRAVLKEIESMPNADETGVADEVAAKRNQRRSKPSGKVGTKMEKQQRRRSN